MTLNNALLFFVWEVANVHYITSRMPKKLLYKLEQRCLQILKLNFLNATYRILVNFHKTGAYHLSVFFLSLGEWANPNA